MNHQVRTCQSIGLTHFSLLGAHKNCGQSIGLTHFSLLGAHENCGQSIGLTGKDRSFKKDGVAEGELEVCSSKFLTSLEMGERGVVKFGLRCGYRKR